MPKPQGTYLSTRKAAATGQVASSAKQVSAGVHAKEAVAFFLALHRISEARLRSWHREMNSLRRSIKANDAISREDRTRRSVANCLGEVKKVLGKAKDLKAIELSLKKPAEMVLHAPRSLETSGFQLVMLIALIDVLTVLLRLRRK